MKITRKSFMTGISAAVLMDWTKLVFADGAPRPFGAGACILDGRIQRLLARALDHDVFPKPVKVEYDPADACSDSLAQLGFGFVVAVNEDALHRESHRTCAREQHLREHCEVLCAKDAVQNLAELCK